MLCFIFFFAGAGSVLDPVSFSPMASCGFQVLKERAKDVT